MATNEPKRQTIIDKSIYFTDAYTAPYAYSISEDKINHIMRLFITSLAQGVSDMCVGMQMDERAFSEMRVLARMALERIQANDIADMCIRAHRDYMYHYSPGFRENSMYRGMKSEADNYWAGNRLRAG